MKQLAQLIKSSQSLLLSTHRQPDGDGLGSQVALYWALKKIGKKVQIVNVDQLPRKYSFLNVKNSIESFDSKPNLEKSDLALIFDTNDRKLMEPLWTELEKKCAKILFIDHHPELHDSPVPSGSYIDIKASSTGQVVYELIKELNIELDDNIARGLYTSIAFDTNNFRFVRSSPTPHLIAAELLRFEINPDEIQRRLFSNHTPQKIQFLSEMLGAVKYEFDGKFAWVRVKKDRMATIGVDFDETRDLIDSMMSIDTLEAACVYREETKDSFKISFRSKGKFPVNALAEALGGGGHLYASGAYIQKPFEEIHKKVITGFESLLKKSK